MAAHISIGDAGVRVTGAARGPHVPQLGEGHCVKGYGAALSHVHCHRVEHNLRDGGGVGQQYGFGGEAAEGHSNAVTKEASVDGADGDDNSGILSPSRPLLLLRQREGRRRRNNRSVSRILPVAASGASAVRGLEAFVVGNRHSADPQVHQAIMRNVHCGDDEAAGVAAAAPERGQLADAGDAFDPHTLWPAGAVESGKNDANDASGGAVRGRDALPGGAAGKRGGAVAANRRCAGGSAHTVKAAKGRRVVAD